MRGGAGAESGEVIPALQGGDDPTLGMARGKLQQLLGYPGVIGFVEQKLRQRIAFLGLNPGGVQHLPGWERPRPGWDSAPKPTRESARAAHGWHRTVGIVSAPGCFPRPR